MNQTPKTPSSGQPPTDPTIPVHSDPFTDAVIASGNWPGNEPDLYGIEEKLPLWKRIANWWHGFTEKLGLDEFDSRTFLDDHSAWGADSMIDYPEIRDDTWKDTEPSAK